MQAVSANRFEQIDQQRPRSFSGSPCRQQPLVIAVEGLRRLVVRVAAGIYKDDVRVKIEHLQSGTCKSEARDVESRRSGNEIEMIAVIGGNLHDIMMLPEWAQAIDQRHIVTAIVFEAEPIVEREQR